MLRKIISISLLLALLAALILGWPLGAFPAWSSEMGDGAPATSTNYALEPALAERLEATCLAALDELKSPGLAVGVVVGQTLAFEGYYGLADRRSGRPMSADALFHVASISKTFAAVGLMRLWEQGRFQLDDDINLYLDGPPVHPAGDKPITFRHLLTHTSGGGELVTMRHAPVIYDGLIPRPLRPGMNYPSLQKIHRTNRMLYRVEPGVKYAYCNYGFVYVGAAIEKLSGESFPTYMEQNVLAPLGMNDTVYVPGPDALARRSTGYISAGKAYLPYSSFTWLNLAAAGVVTNVRDMAKYMAAMLNHGAGPNGQVLAPETLDRMFTFHHTFDPRQQGIGLGFMIHGENVWGRKIVGHNGSYMTETSQLLLSPQDRVGIFVYSNSSTNSPVELAWAIIKDALGAVDAPPPALEPRRELWKELVGYYGPEHRDLNTSMRLNIGGLRRYRVKIVGAELKLIMTGKRREKAKTLIQASAEDPYFFQIEDPDAIRPSYVSFRHGPNGKLYICPGGLSEYIKLGALRTLAAKMTEKW